MVGWSLAKNKKKCCEETRIGGGPVVGKAMIEKRNVFKPWVGVLCAETNVKGSVLGSFEDAPLSSTVYHEHIKVDARNKNQSTHCTFKLNMDGGTFIQYRKEQIWRDKDRPHL